MIARRSFLAGLLATTAIAPVASLLPAPASGGEVFGGSFGRSMVADLLAAQGELNAIYSGYLGVFEGVRFHEGAAA